MQCILVSQFRRVRGRDTDKLMTLSDAVVDIRDGKLLSGILTGHMTGPHEM